MGNKITIGDRVFTHEDIDSGNCYQTVSLLSESLEINYMEVNVKSSDNLKTLPQDTPMTYFCDEKQMGIFYIQTIKRTGADTYNIYAISTIGLLDKTDHFGGIYTGQTADEIIRDICGTVRYSVKTNLKNVKMYGWLPVASRRDNLSQVLFALGAALKTDLNGVLRIEGLWDGISRSIGKDQMYSGGSVNYEDEITGISVTEHQYTLGGESSKLFEGTTQEGDIITFSEPAYDLTATGFSIIESGANYAKLSSGSGTLTGSKYIHITREIARSIGQGPNENTKTVKDATLVSLVNSSATLDRLESYYRCRETIDNDVVYGGERVGDLASFYHPYDHADVPTCLQEIDISLSNQLSSSEKGLVGFLPVQIEDSVTFEHMEILTGNGVWQAPDGVTSVRAVLIDGGSFGQAGENGGGGNTPTSDTKNASNYKNTGPNERITANVTANTPGTGTPGAGGKAGTGGAGGRILQEKIEVGDAREISFSCGGTVGFGESSETVFGELTSANGSRSSNGYTDPITGITYAAPGKAGTDGGKGGSTGQPGENTDGATGGAPMSGGTLNREGNDHSYNSGNLTATHWLGSASYQIGSGGGGGAGGDGENGGPAQFDSREISLSVNGASATATGRAVRGGSGGNGKAGKAGTVYGTGGDGGGGGGGVGAPGTISISISGTAYWEKTDPVNSKVTNQNISITLRATALSGSGGLSGKGGAGGSGVEGCIILYYGVKKALPSGPVLSRDGKIFCDSEQRQFVV